MGIVPFIHRVKLRNYKSIGRCDVVLNQSQSGMYIWAVAGIGPGGAPECLGPGLQDRTAAALHLVLPAGQSGEEISDPLLNGRLASQAQVARRLLSRPSPDRLVGVEVRAVTRQIHQPQPRCPQILPHRLATMGRRVVPNHIQRPRVSLAQLGQEGRRCPGVAVTLQFHPLHLPGLQANRRVVAGLLPIARAAGVNQSLPS